MTLSVRSTRSDRESNNVSDRSRCRQGPREIDGSRSDAGEARGRALEENPERVAVRSGVDDALGMLDTGGRPVSRGQQFRHEADGGLRITGPEVRHQYLSARQEIERIHRPIEGL